MENDVRVSLLNTLLQTPHGDLEKLMPVHRQIIETDPLFYVHLAAWYRLTGKVRDHNDLFVFFLTHSTFPGHREVGLALAGQLPPHQLSRVTLAYRQQKKMLPRSFKGEIRNYLAALENNENRFDRAVLGSRKALKALYRTAHASPGRRAQLILFEDAPPIDSLPGVVRIIQNTPEQSARARLIVEHNLPWTVATSLINADTPAGLIALINAMTPAQLMNNMASIRKAGAFNNAEVTSLVRLKLGQAKTDKRVSAYKASTAALSSGLPDDETGETIREALEDVRTTQTRAVARITRPTALLVDKSSSLNAAIDFAKQVGAMIAGVTDAPLFVWAFDSAPIPVQAPETDNIGAWERAFLGIRASGETSIGAGVQALRIRKQTVEQIVIITDEGENRSPTFATAYQQYAAEMGVRPNVILILVGRHDPQRPVQNACRTLDVECNVLTPQEDKGTDYALPNLLPLLTRRGMVDLIMDIMDTRLPQRRR